MHILKDLGVNIIVEIDLPDRTKGKRWEGSQDSGAEKEKAAVVLPLSKCTCTRMKSTPKSMISPEKRRRNEPRTEGPRGMREKGVRGGRR